VSSPFALWAGPRVEVAPFRLSGTVYATLLNHRRSLEALGDAVAAAPYKGAPKSVVLAVKPRLALVAPGGEVQIDGGAEALEIGAALGVVIGTTACANRRRQDARMKRARVAYSGAIHEATPAGDDSIRLADGRVVAETEVVWLPPFEVGTVIALGLNYADHAKELAFKPQDEPLVFLKGPSALIGHRGATRRPADATFMHYECELAVVIGKPARRVARADAMAHVAGYTIANDYAIRDYLENWYRPNLRVKSRDGATALGPWLVDAADVEAPPQRALRTLVNGRQTQSGHTRDLVFDVAFLIEYLSEFMTLAPGDVILTGTPEGVVNVDVGDEVVCEIEGLGRLVNRIAGDAEFGRGGTASAQGAKKESA